MVSLIIGLLLFIASPLHAYIDPGTGSLLVSTIVGMVITILFSARNVFYHLIAGMHGRNFKNENDFSGKIVFFNEGKNYWNIFRPVIEALLEREVPLVYLSAEKEDTIVPLTEKYSHSPHLTTHYLGSIKKAIPFLNTLKADICIMTTPQINILTLKRSKHVRHYSHIIHAPDDIHTYKKFAFDYFDSVLCSNSYQIKNIRQLEHDRNKPAKQLLETGCTYYNLTSKPVSISDDNTILLAPTWGEKSFLKEHGEAIIEHLLEHNYTVIFRPHPQSWTADKYLLDDIIARFEGNDKFFLDNAIDNNEAIAKSSLVLCDISGMVYDVAFIHHKSVISIVKDSKTKGYEGYTLTSTPSVISLVEDIGKVMSTDDISNLDTIIKTLSTKQINENIISKHIFNFQNAGKIAANQILDIHTLGQKEKTC